MGCCGMYRRELDAPVKTEFSPAGVPIEGAPLGTGQPLDVMAPLFYSAVGKPAKTSETNTQVFSTVPAAKA